MDLTKYENKMKYPEGLPKPFLKHDHTSAEAQAHTKALKIYEEKLPAYRKAKQDYRDEDNRLTELFKIDAFKELGVENHPKKDVLWSLAYDDGHSEGLNGIWYVMLELVELMK